MIIKIKKIFFLFKSKKWGIFKIKHILVKKTHWRFKKKNHIGEFEKKYVYKNPKKL